MVAFLTGVADGVCFAFALSPLIVALLAGACLTLAFTGRSVAMDAFICAFLAGVAGSACFRILPGSLLVGTFFALTLFTAISVGRSFTTLAFFEGFTVMTFFLEVAVGAETLASVGVGWLILVGVLDVC